MIALTEAQIQQVIDRSLVGRQNAHTRSARKDAQAVLRDPTNSACMESALMNWHRWFADPERMPVIRCDPSPMNPKRKVLKLACMHEVWSGRKSKFAACPTCAASRKDSP